MRPNQLRRLYNLLFERKLSLRYDRMIFPRTGLRAKQVWNFILSRLESRLRRRRPRSYPIGLQLEPTTHCQLECPLCPRDRATRGAGPAHMKWESYERLIAEVGPRLIVIAFWQWGEPLLYPRIVDMVRTAHERGVLTLISTNGQVDPLDMDLAGILAAGLDMLIISMEGVTQPVYERFRAGGSVRRVRQFTREAIRIKRELGMVNPLINVRALATRESEAEIEQVRSFARQVGADLFSVKGVSLYYDANPRNRHLPRAIRYRTYQYQGEREAEAYRRMPNLCTKPWAWPLVRHDGTLLVCECDHDMEHVLGNVFTAPSFRDVWRGKRAEAIRRHFPSDGRIELAFCRRCRYKLDDAIRHVERLGDGPG